MSNRNFNLQKSNNQILKPLGITFRNLRIKSFETFPHQYKLKNTFLSFVCASYKK